MAVNPIISQLTKEIVSTAQRGQQTMAQVEKAGPSKFDKIMEQTKQTPQENQTTKKLADAQWLDDPTKFKTTQAKNISPDQVKEVAKPQTSGDVQTSLDQGQQKADRIIEMIGDVNDGANHLEKLMEVLSSGQKLSPQELIAIQLSVTQFAEELEIAGKLVQESTQGVRQTLNTQIG